MRRALALRRAAGRRSDPNPRVGCVLLDRDGARGRRRASTAAPAPRTPRSTRWPGGRRRGPRRARPSSRSSRATTPAAPARAPQALRRGRGAPGRATPRPTRTRVAAAAPTRLRAAGVEVERRRAGRRGARAQPGLDASPSSTAARSSPGSSRPRSTAGAPPPTARSRVDHSGRSPAPTCTGCAPGATPMLVGTGTVLADDPRLTVRDADGRAAGDRQPLRAVMGLRAAARRRPACSTTRAGRCCCRTRDPARGPAPSSSARERQHVLLEGGPTLAAAFLRAGLVDEVVAYVAPVLLGSGRAAVGDLGITTHRRTSAARRSATSRTDRPGRPTSALTDPPRESTDVHRHRRGARHRRPSSSRRDAVRLTVRGPPCSATPRTATRSRQRRLPDRGRARRRDASPPT